MKLLLTPQLIFNCLFGVVGGWPGCLAGWLAGFLAYRTQTPRTCLLFWTQTDTKYLSIIADWLAGELATGELAGDPATGRLAAWLGRLGKLGSLGRLDRLASWLASWLGRPGRQTGQLAGWLASQLAGWLARMGSLGR